jgi:hypothetical protein
MRVRGPGPSLTLRVLDLGCLAIEALHSTLDRKDELLDTYKRPWAHLFNFGLAQLSLIRYASKLTSLLRLAPRHLACQGHTFKVPSHTRSSSQRGFSYLGHQNQREHYLKPPIASHSTQILAGSCGHLPRAILT